MTRPAFLLGPVLLLLAWATAALSGLVDAFFLPDPLATVRALAALLRDGRLLADAGATLTRVAIAFAAAAAVGLPAGLVLGSLPRVYRAVEFPIDFFRSMPATALFPLFLLVFGVTDSSKIMLAAFTSCLVVIFNTAYGVIHGRKARVLAARMMGAGRCRIFRTIVFWEALPQSVVGLRGAVSLSLVVVVVTEMFIGTELGLGRRIIDAQITYAVPDMYAVILFTGLVGYLANGGFVLAEATWLRWSGR